MRIFGLEIRDAPTAPVLKIARRMATPLAAVTDQRGQWRPLVREPYTGAWQRNDEWTTDTVLAHHAVYACVTRIAQDIGKLRPRLVQESDDGIWGEVQNPAFSPVLRRPNRFQNHIQFKEWWTTSKLIHGNAYALKRRDGRRVVDALYLLDPVRVTPMVAADGEVFYRLKTDHLSEIQADEINIPASEIVHDRINCLFHPLVGTSPIFACGMAANMGLQIERNSSGFFGNGSNPSGILAAAVSISPQKSEELSTLWNSQFAGDRSGKVAVLGDGMTFTPMRMNAVDSQLIEQLQWTAETVCSAFHVPPWKLGIGQMPAYTNPEIANQTYYSDCLQSPIEQFELAMDEALGIAGTKLGVELDLDGLLRMDSATQVKTLAEAVGGSIMVPNEARRRMDLPPKQGGDQIWMQQQNYSLEALAERDRNDPFAKPAPAPAALPPGEPEAEPEEDEEDAQRAAFALFVDACTFDLELAS